MLGNAVNFLAEHKEIQEKLRAEIKEYDHITFEELHQMPYLDAVVNGKQNRYFKVQSIDRR